MGKAIGVVFVGPSLASQGGISTVISNVQASRFWSEARCFLYANSTETGSRWLDLAYQFKQIVCFLPFLIGNRPRVLSVHTASRLSFYRSLIYVLLGRLLAVPVVLHVHSAFFYDFYRQSGRLGRFLIELAGRLSARVVFLADSIQANFIGVFAADKMSVIANPVNVAQFAGQSTTDFSQKKPLLFMGWIVKEKGVYDIVDVIAEVAEQFPEVEFWFAGNKEVEQLRRLIDQRQLNAVAKVLGWVAGQQRLDLLHSSYCLLLPSYTEGIPNVILEAMACGLPVITTPVGGIPSVVVSGVTGLFVMPGQPIELADAIKQLLASESFRSDLSRAALERAKAEFDVEMIGEKLQQLYQEFIG